MNHKCSQLRLGAFFYAAKGMAGFIDISAACITIACVITNLSRMLRLSNTDANVAIKKSPLQ